MWEKLEEELRCKIDEKYTLIGDCWLALNELKSLSDGCLAGEDIIRVVFHTADDEYYYVKPGNACVYGLHVAEFLDCSWGNARKVELSSLDICALRDLFGVVCAKSAQAVPNV